MHPQAGRFSPPLRSMGLLVDQVLDDNHQPPTAARAPPRKEGRSCAPRRPQPGCGEPPRHRDGSTPGQWPQAVERACPHYPRALCRACRGGRGVGGEGHARGEARRCRPRLVRCSMQPHPTAFTVRVGRSPGGCQPPGLRAVLSAPVYGHRAPSRGRRAAPRDEIATDRCLTPPPLARYVILMISRPCEQCGRGLPRSWTNEGRPRIYCSAACRQRAYRARGGRASGTSGGARARAQSEQSTPSGRVLPTASEPDPPHGVDVAPAPAPDSVSHHHDNQVSLPAVAPRTTRRASHPHRRTVTRRTA